MSLRLVTSSNALNSRLISVSFLSQHSQSHLGPHIVQHRKRQEKKPPSQMNESMSICRTTGAVLNSGNDT